MIILGLAEIKKCYIVHHILYFIYSLNYILTGLVARKITEMFLFYLVVDANFYLDFFKS